MTDFLENMNFDGVDEETLNEASTLDEASTFVEATLDDATFNEANTRPNEECTSLPAFERELSGIFVEGSLINVLYDLMGCTVCGAVAKNLLAYLQHNETLTMSGEDTSGNDRTLTLRLDASGDVAIDDTYDSHSWTGSEYSNQFTGSVYGVACTMVHGYIFYCSVRGTDIVSGLRAEHHYRQPYWWHDERDTCNIGNQIIELLFASPDCWGTAYVAEV